MTIETATAYVLAMETKWGFASPSVAKVFICDDQGRPANAGTGMVAVKTANNEWIVWMEGGKPYGEC